MPILVKCPACKALNQISDDERGQVLRCGKCAQPFSVPAAIGTQKRAEKDAIQESRKVNAASSRKRDEHDANYDRENRPVRTKKAEPAKGGVRVLLAVGGVAAVLLCCVLGAGGIGVVFMFRAKPHPAEDKLAKADGQKGEEKKDNPGEQKKDPLVDPDAGKPLPPQLAPDLVAKVKQATVYLHVTMPSGVTAEGSGFFALERGIIVTNAHVLGMMLETSRAPKHVAVVQDSGLATETRMVGDVLGVDRVSDLAVIRVPDNGKLPTPLTLSGDAPAELQRVYIFGFPFGEKLGKNITISEQAITSLRPDKSGGLDQIQVNGGMNPGNSGGPVVDTRGNLVGVSVSIITGAQISFSVPAEKVRRVMEGRVTDHQHGDAYVQQGGTYMPVRLKCLDPLNRIRDMRVEVWTGPPGAPRPRSNERPQALPGEGPRHEHAVKYAGGVGAVDVPLPQLPAGHLYWV
jgi:S1-C subfamily serine protease